MLSSAAWQSGLVALKLARRINSSKLAVVLDTDRELPLSNFFLRKSSRPKQKTHRDDQKHKNRLTTPSNGVN